ncbi:hypothetical protein Glove_33g145 [Diversispora epigaea]|uniref:BTB domain-containing protein n=1 Tax=Diversispora epigaea TaxID=1348612 RepID=A0A397JI46_9GLOM|nr:hypothetical protein Glove_33g145 [Diversispora epigaea]
MTLKFFDKLSRNFIELLDDKDDHNVIIEVENTKKSFTAHSSVLKYRSPYFRMELENIQPNENNVKIITKSSISTQIFDVILKYIYGGIVNLENVETKFIFDLMLVANEFKLEELTNKLETTLIDTKSSWLKTHFSLVYRTIFDRQNFKKLENYCIDIIVKYSNLIFESSDFTSLQESALVPLLKRDDLQMKEVEIWDYVIKWGIAQNPTLPIDLKEWTKENFITLKNTLQQCLPYIRYFQLSSTEIFDKIKPYKKIIDKQLWEDINQYFWASDRPVKSIILPARSILVTELPPRTNEPKEHFSTIISEDHAAEISAWIDHGLNPQNFWDICHGHASTVVVLTVKGTGEIIGGYNPLAWDNSNIGYNYQHAVTNDSFIFSLKNGNIQISILSRVKHPNYAILNIGKSQQNSYGPFFGVRGGSDFYMCSNQSNFTLDSSCFCHNQGASYERSISSTTNFSIVDYEESNNTSPPHKRQKKEEALQELMRVRPDLKGKKVYFFPTLDKYFEGILMYDAKEKRAQVYCMKKDLKFETFSQWINSLKNRGFFKGHKSAIATIFLESNPSSSPISSILRESNYKLYWKNSNLVYISDILQIVQEKVKPGGKFAGTSIKEINNELEFYFPTTEQLSTKILKIFCKSGFQSYEIYALNKIVQEIYLPVSNKLIKRTINDIIKIIDYAFSVNICSGQSTKGFEDVTKIRGNQLVSNDKDHMPIALMENIGLPNELYRRIDCTLVVKENVICERCSKLKIIMKQIQQRNLLGVNSKKIIHASKEILVEKINLQQKIIKNQNKLISKLRDRLYKKVENEENEVSNEISNIIHNVSEKVGNKSIDISNYHPIFQELIRIQTEKPKGTRYHPMFLRWAISVYCKSGHAAYDAMKLIMRLPSISTLKNYINEREQKSGWNDKIAHQLLINLTINNIWGYGRVGFFSHDSFKIQKGLLWSQRENCYVGYLDLDDDTHDYQAFAIRCQQELESDSLLDSISNEFNLATQVHQIVWHSLTFNFSFPISYYGINNITAHNLNTIIFELAAKLEYIENIQPNENNVKIITKSSISTQIFDVILKYIYGGIVNLENVETKFIFDLMLVANEFKLEELTNKLETTLIDTKSSWLKTHFSLVYRTIFDRQNFKKLENYCIDIIVKYSNLIFESSDFTSLQESALVPLLKRDDLQMKEVEIWDYVIKWGIAQNPTLPIDLKEWTKENFITLKNTLQQCLPYIRYFQLSSTEIFDKIKPYKKIIDKQLWEDINQYFWASDRPVKSIILPARSILVTELPPRTNEPKEHFSTIISEDHAAEISAWIDRKTTNYLTTNNPYKFELILRGTRD